MGFMPGIFRGAVVMVYSDTAVGHLYGIGLTQ